MKRLLPFLALLLSAPVFAASDVTPVYPDLVLVKEATTTVSGSPQRTQPVAYQITATGTGATVSATVKVYCKAINLTWASGTQQGSDITLSASNTDVDTSVTVTGACPYLYADVTAISSTTVNVVATPMYSAAAVTTNNAAGQYADDADFADGTSVSVLAGGVADVASSIPVTEGDVGAFAMTLHRGLKTSIYTPNDDSAMDDTADAVKVLNYVSENDSTLAASSNIPTTACTTGGSCTTLVNGYGLGAIAATRCLLTIAAGSDAGNFDAAKVYLCNGATSPGTGATSCANVLGGSTGVTSAHYTAPAVGSPLQWAVSYTRSSGVVDDGNLVDLGSGQTWQGMLNVAGANSLYVEVSSDAATLDATPYITCN